MRHVRLAINMAPLTGSKAFLQGLLLSLVILGWATASSAQAPGWSRGQQNLAITYDECLRRMPAALRAEGYRVDYFAGDFSVGVKGVHTAVIMCNPAPDRKMWVNIVVGSNGDGGGRERQCLQAQMERPGAYSTCGNNAICTKWTWAYAPAGQEPVVHGNETVTICPDGKLSSTSGASGTWTRTGNAITLRWNNGSVDNLYLNADESVMSGTNHNGWNVRGTRQ